MFLFLSIGLRGGLFAFEELDAFVKQGSQNIGTDLHLVRGDHCFFNSRDEQLVANLFGQRAFVFLEKAALSGEGFNDAQALQLRVSLGDGVAIDAQFLRQRTN